MAVRETRWPVGTPCWIDLAVPDVPAALEFYGAVLGWTFQDTGQENGGYRMCLTGGRPAAGLGDQHLPDQPSFWTLYLAADNADAAAAAITENGGSVLVEPFDVGEAGRIAIVQDPTGATFGVWQSGTSIGMEVYNEPGALVWEDLRLTDLEAGKRFYADVFDFGYEAVPGVPEAEYAAITLGGESIGGIGGMPGAPEGTPSHWIGYFGVPDVDAAAAAVRAGGGRITDGPSDTPHGRIAGAVDPFGAIFNLHQDLGSGTDR